MLLSAHGVIFEAGLVPSAVLQDHDPRELLEGRVHVDIVCLQLHLCGFSYLLHQSTDVQREREKGERMEREREREREREEKEREREERERERGERTSDEGHSEHRKDTH